MAEEPDIDWSDSEIKQIHSTSEADKLMKSTDLCMVVVYAKWCGHCKNAAPELKKLSSKMKDKAKIYVIESAEYEGNIKSYPTILIVKGGKSSEYQGPREADDMAKALLGGSLGGKRSRRGRTSRLRNRRRKTHRASR